MIPPVQVMPNVALYGIVRFSQVSALNVAYTVLSVPLHYTDAYVTVLADSGTTDFCPIVPFIYVKVCTCIVALQHCIRPLFRTTKFLSFPKLGQEFESIELLMGTVLLMASS